MDSFGGFSGEGEWDLCSSLLSLEQLDFTPVIPPATAGMADWFCSLDSFTANLPSCVFGANSRNENGNAIDQFPGISAAAAADDDHHHYMSMSNGAIEEKKMDSIFSACSDILLQEITGFSCEDQLLNMDVQTHVGNDNTATNPAQSFHHKRKCIVVADDDHHHNKLNNPNKKIRTSNNVQKTRKATQSSGNSDQKLSTRRRKCEEDQENGGSDMNSCSSDNSSEDDNASQDTNGGGTVLEGEASPPKPKTRATRGSATDPQSLYARKRRERINERLRILQKLVPNGTKVDISTMLEEAVHYVKFLQLQIKLLSSDELWMYAPIAYNGMDIGLQQKLPSIL